MVRIDGAIVRRGPKVLLGPVHLELADRGITAIVGPNGSGKSTLLRMMHGLERARGGGVDWGVPLLNAGQAFLFQTPIHLRRSVQENLELPLKLRGTTKTDIAKRTRAAAEKFGLIDLLQSYAPNLSGGEKQKLALARAMITYPQILFLDEPSANLDRRSTQLIEDTVQDAEANGTRVFLASHSMAQVRRLADTVVFVENGVCHGPFPTLNFLDNPTPKAAKDWLEDD